MRVVYTGDWQLQWYNLNKIKKLVSFILDLKPDMLVHLGDLKHQMNPLDMRVVNYCVQLVKRLNSRGIKFVMNSGNHDMLGMSDTSGSWAPTLRAAGAVVFEETGTFETKDLTIHAVPFSRHLDTTKSALNKQARTAHNTSVLIFHTDIVGAKQNVSTRDTSPNHISVDSLHFSKYVHCVGGHIHLPQKLAKNVWLAGSPIAHDWSEVNQVKRVLVGEYKNGKSSMTAVPVPIPGMYDPTLPSFRESKPSNWKGAQVRVHVAFDPAEKITLQRFLTRAEEEAQKRYPEAKIVVDPEFLDAKTDLSIKSNTSDVDVIRHYVEKTCPPSIKYKESVVQYILAKLARLGMSLRGKDRVAITRAKAKNFLSFADLDVSYEPGITVVTGENKDWPNRNNGSGKTSYLQPAAVALCGKTLKEQESDRWVRRGSTGEAWIKLYFRFKDGRKGYIFRGRRPVKLRLVIDGKDYSTGMGLRGTQEAIEVATGITWESLRNAVYLDQAKINELLSGTDKQRKTIFAKFLNLERFAKARDVVAKIAIEIDHKIALVKKDIEAVQEEIKSVKQYLADMQDNETVSVLANKLLAIKKSLRAIRDQALPQPPARIDELKEAKDEVFFQLRKASAQLLDVSDELVNKVDVCSKCGQKITDANADRHRRELVKEKHRLQELTQKLGDRFKKAQTRYRAKEEAMMEYMAELAENKSRIRVLGLKVEQFEDQLAKAKKLAKIHKRYKHKLAQCRKRRDDLTAYRTQLEADWVFEKYCVKSLSKDGIPAYLSASICPRLTNSAAIYSKIFADNEIRVAFKLDAQGDIDIDVVNLHGGEKIADQSQGETNIASMVIGFAICDVVSPCNLLILDEPGTGLDEYNAKVFAEGIQRIAKGRGPVLLTSHSPYILNALEGERIVKVTKRKRVSTAENV